MGKRPMTEHDPDAVRRIDALKVKWGLATDTELAERLGKPQSFISQWKRRGMTDIVAKLIDEILEGTGQLWLMSA